MSAPEPPYPPHPGQPGQPPQPPPPTQGWAPPPAYAPPPAAAPPPPPAAAPGPPPAGGPSRASGMLADPSTLAATGLLAAVLFAIVGGLFGFLASPAGSAFRSGAFKGRLLALTETVDVGDVALLGIAVALLLLTPDPPGGINRSILLQATSLLAAVITLFGIIRALVVITLAGSGFLRFGGFVATVGVAVAAATVAFYAATESFLKKKGQM